MKTGLGRQITESRLFGPHMLEDPYPVYRRLREEAPLHWDTGLNAWIATRHDDVTAILKDPRFSSERVAPVVARLYPDPKYAPLFDILALTMVNRDDPDHARLRRLVNAAFQRTEVNRWEGRIREIVDELLDGILARAARPAADAGSEMPLPGRPAGKTRGQTGGAPVDFIADFAIPLPVLVISELVGIPIEDRVRVKGWCDDFAQVALNFYTNLSVEQLDRGLAGVTAFRAYLADMAAHHRANPPTRPPHPDGETERPAPGETLFAHLVHAEEDEERLTLDELLANTLLLLSAGNETTTSLIANGLMALLREPDGPDSQLAKLRADPSLIPGATDEFLRYDPPVQFLGRLAHEDIELHGETIRQGQLTVAVMAAANRDPAAFDAPDSLDVARYCPHAGGASKVSHHLSFGHGRHLCPGRQLALLEAQIAFERIFERMDGLDLAEGAVPHRDNFNMRCPARLPIRFAR